MKWNIVIGSLMLGMSLSAPSFGGGLLDHMLGLKGSGCDSACCDTGCSADPTCGCEISACGSGCATACEPSCGCETACADACAPSCGCEVVACDPCGCDTGCSKPRRKPLLDFLSKMHDKKMSLLGCGKGCDSGCDTGCCAEPTCGCEVAACDPCGCGAAPTCGCEIADACAPSCGCEVVACDPCGCDSGCGSKKRSCGGLLGKLFKKKSKSCCDSGCAAAPTCGCEVSCAAPACSSCMSTAPAPVAAPAVSGDAAPAPPAPIVDPSAYLQTNRRVIQAASYNR